MNTASFHRTGSARRSRRARPSVLWLALAAAALAQAEPQQGTSQAGVRATRSMGYRSAVGDPGDHDLKDAALTLGPGLRVSGARAAPARPESKASDPPRAAGAVRRPSLLAASDVWFYSTESMLHVDADGDGYFHAFSIAFDADLQFGGADVYARLYLSYEGGPWNHYATTDVFAIQASDPDDAYVVDTVLEGGYPRGHYDVLIELYEAYEETRIASVGPAESYALTALPLEDAGRDQGYVDSSRHGGGGGLGVAGLLSLAGLGLRRRLRSR